MALASISVDLDSLHHYCRIHSLPEEALTEEQRALVYARAVPRFLALFAELGLPATFFVIGEDAQQAFGREALERAHAAGVELGNHTLHHPYGLTRLPADEQLAEVRGGADALEAVTGVRPVGFRAPGYTLSAGLYRTLEREGYRYDASVFPATPYYLAKALVLGGLALTGRPSRAVLDRPRVLTAPRAPYWPDPNEPYRSGQGRVLELPVTVAPVTRVPFFGTLAVWLPAAVTRALYASVRGVPLLSFELHGLDALDATDGLPTALLRRQRELNVPWALKRARLAALFEAFRADFELVTLAEAATRLASA